MGATFEGYQTPFGTTDGTYSEVRFLTLTPTVAYAVNEDVAVGVSLNAGYSDVKFRFYPNTSYYDGGTGYGFLRRGPHPSARLKAWNWSTRVGAMWTATPRLQFGAMYQTKTQGDYENGKLGLNQSAIGLGEVTYDAKVEGFAWPAQFGGGVQVRPADRWIITADVRRYLWSDAMKEIDVRGSNPDAASPVTAPVMAFVFNWRDVWATSVGGAEIPRHAGAHAPRGMERRPEPGARRDAQSALPRDHRAARDGGRQLDVGRQLPAPRGRARVRIGTDEPEQPTRT